LLGDLAAGVLHGTVLESTPKRGPQVRLVPASYPAAGSAPTEQMEESVVRCGYRAPQMGLLGPASVLRRQRLCVPQQVLMQAQGTGASDSTRKRT
jgi:hypothetical protein